MNQNSLTIPMEIPLGMAEKRKLAFIYVFEINSKGNCVEVPKTLEDLSRLKSEWNLPMSDMRMFFHQHHNLAEDGGLPVILSRPSSQCFLVSLEHIKLLCRKDTCVILHSQNENVRLFAEDLRKQLSNRDYIYMASNEYANMHAFLKAMTSNGEVKLEFAVMETTLATVTNKFKKHLNLLKPILDILLQETLSNPTRGVLRRMLAFMKNLNAFETSVTMVRSAINGILQEEEDLAGLCFGNNNNSSNNNSENEQVNNHNTQDEDEEDKEKMELLLEAYSSDLKEVECELANIKEQIDDTNDFMNIHLNTVRNSFMKMSVVMELGTLVVGLGAVVAGLFGMNVPNGFEEVSHAFTVISVSTVCGILLVGLLFFIYVRRYTSVNSDIGNTFSLRAFGRFFEYAHHVESAILEDKQETINKKEFRQVLEPVIGMQLTQNRLSKVFRVLFLDDAAQQELEVQGKRGEEEEDLSGDDDIVVSPRKSSFIYDR